jgi:hypothetical protein
MHGHNCKFESRIIATRTVAAGVASSNPSVKMSLFSANRAHANVIPFRHIKALPCSASFGFTPYLKGKLLPVVIMICFPGFYIV